MSTNAKEIIFKLITLILMALRRYVSKVIMITRIESKAVHWYAVMLTPTLNRNDLTMP